MILISHRINTIANSDKILVMSDVNKAEFESPKVLLLDKKSEYSKLYLESMNA